MAASNIIKIDGKEYPIDSLSDETKDLLKNLRVVDREIMRLRQQLAIAQTARMTYARSVKVTLAKEEDVTVTA